MTSTSTWRRLWGPVGNGLRRPRFTPGTPRRKGFPSYAKITPSCPIEPRSSGVGLHEQTLPLSDVSLLITDKFLHFLYKSLGASESHYWGRTRRRSSSSAYQCPSRGHRVKGAFGVARDRFATLDPLTAHQGIFRLRG